MGIQEGVDYYVEVSDCNKHGTPPRLVHQDDLASVLGFRSVYAYPVETCRWIRDNGGVRGLTSSGMPVFSNRLFIDVDEDPESAAKFVECLKKWNVTHSVWDSGNRSVHIHILIEPMVGVDVPYSQKRFLTSWGASIGATADLSIYHAAGLYRLPHTLHDKTGKPKVLVDQHWGNALDIPIVERQDVSSGEASLNSVWRLLLTPMQEGGRRLHVYKITTNAVQIGWDEDKILKHLRAWNSWLEPQYRLPDEELEGKMWKSL